MGLGWIIIFVSFNQWVDDPVGYSSVNQENEIVYQSLKECSDEVLNLARKRFPDQKFGVSYYDTIGEDEERIEVTTLDQSGSGLILHHKFTCMKIKGFE